MKSHAMGHTPAGRPTTLSPLFQPVTTRTVDHSYTEAEAKFYNVMSEFILDECA
ncbi:hypothetical protein MAA8898_03374 [Maliponia aquimaris]|uniref:Uncharacterized protein n=1 Tax=Maliponia aquimaris TaxID=1673631 RepID=A0A238KUC3_9RHOB|nr:hypothetical protein MAA8898_03374 [Maliponia aquimaris]